jgi:pseudouridine-5'-phosphate glycosidase
MVDLHDEVAAALHEGRAVLALESTVISHGLPAPRNLEVALALEDLARTRGVVPATIAVLAGRIRVGLDRAGIERLARPEGIAKLSRRDLAHAVSRGADGATTVSATMVAARAAGVAVFATGGIGGVHRDVVETLDVSADLLELARTCVVVVCAGAKAILDLARTVELLETQGVPVVGYGTDELPAFYSRSSGVRVPLRADSAEELAAMYHTQRRLGLDQGILVANPIPPEHELGAPLVDRWVRRAVREARRQGVRGSAITPLLLSRLAQLSRGRTLESNVALLEHNVKLGCEVALAVAATARTR